MAISAQIPLNLEPSRPDRFEGFVDGPNRAAVAALKDILNQRGASIFLHGPKASGKTHLLNALCSLARQRGLTAFYVPARRLSAHAEGDAGNDAERDATAGIRDLHSVELVCLDDLDVVAGMALWEESVFHCFNNLRDKGGNMVISSRLPLNELQLNLPDLRSRLGWDLQLGLQLLDDQQKLEVLHRRAGDMGYNIPEEVVGYLLRRRRRDLGSLTSIVDLICQAALAGKRKITVPLAREVLAADPGRRTTC